MTAESRGRTSVKGRTYLRAVDAAVRAGVPAALGGIQHQNRGWQAKWWFGNPALHYELTLRVRERTVEIGLHFEADPLTNAQLLAAFRAHARRIARHLGDVRIEEWDRGWARVWEPIAMTEPPSTGNAGTVGMRLALYINTLEPILREELPAEVPWELRTAALASSNAGARRRPPSSRAAPRSPSR